MASGVSFLDRVHSRYMKESAKRFSRRPFTIETSIPIVSFTFDDFPKSALYTGGEILGEYGAAGTYYASFGLMGTEAPTGTMFVPEDLKMLFDKGHELGCHTYSHCHSWDTDPSAFEQSVIRNQQALSDLIPGAVFRSISYPISVPRPRTKEKIAKYFACCRCGGQTYNAGEADASYLSAYFLEKTRHDFSHVERVIEQNRAANGWLILATHDISGTPTQFGCTPTFFEEVVRKVVDSGARILPVIRAWEELQRRC